MSVKVEYKLVGSAGGYTTLCDFSDTLKDFNPQTNVGAMQREALDADAGSQGAQFRQAKGNISVKFALDITKTYSDEATASAGARTITLAFASQKLNLKVTKSTDVEYYPNATCDRLTIRHSGSTIQIAMQLESDLVTASEP